MGYILYIGAALVIGFLIGFIALSITWLRRMMVRNVRTHTLALISTYDDLLAEKSLELRDMREEMNEYEAKMAAETAEEKQSVKKEVASSGIAPGAVIAAVENAQNASYRDSAVGDTYRQIRGNFSFHVEEILPLVTEQSKRTGKSQAGPAGKTLEILDFDTVYQLSTLSSEEQLMVLSESLPAGGLELLEEYLELHPQFDAIRFYDYLKSRSAAEPKGAKLYVPAGTYVGAGSRNSVEILYDSGICEGFQAEMGGKLYDYCIKTKELV